VLPTQIPDSGPVPVSCTLSKDLADMPLLSQGTSHLGAHDGFLMMVVAVEEEAEEEGEEVVEEGGMSW